MFSTLLKDKIEIEERVRKLQNKYIDAIKLRKFENSEDSEFMHDDKEKKAAKALVEENQKSLEIISAEYKSAIQSHNQLSAIIKEQKDVTSEMHGLVTSLLKNLNLEVPEELLLEKRVVLPAEGSLPLPTFSKAATVASQLGDIELSARKQQKDNNFDESDKENSSSEETEEGEHFSLKRPSQPLSAYTAVLKSNTNLFPRYK
jgi:hypothetical protein